MSQTYYDILVVDKNADSGTIRKAYLKLSLKHHPDKNPDNVEAAKAKFVEIGQAYETLSDPQARAMYDRELRSGGARPFGMGGNNSSTNGGGGGGYYNGNSGPDVQFTSSKSYESYQDAFDATVAGMSEAELAAAVGTVTAIASVVGSLVGSRMMAGKRGGGGGVLGAAGSIMGSMVASEMAASSVKALHQQSIQRIAYREECRRAVERGEPIPEPPPTTKWDEVIQKTVDTVKGVTQNQGTRGSINNLWNIAKTGVQAAVNNLDNKGGAGASGTNTFR